MVVMASVVIVDVAHVVDEVMVVCGGGDVVGGDCGRGTCGR